MYESEKLAIAAHLHVMMRRKIGRVTDVEWITKNLDYAREVIRVARAEPHPELHEWAAKLEAALMPAAARPVTPVGRPAGGPESRPAPLSADTGHGELRSERYVGRLR